MTEFKMNRKTTESHKQKPTDFKIIRSALGPVHSSPKSRNFCCSCVTVKGSRSGFSRAVCLVLAMQGQKTTETERERTLETTESCATATKQRSENNLFEK